MMSYRCWWPRWGVSALQPMDPSLQFAFVNKALLEPNHIHPFTYRLWLLLCYNSKVQQKPYGPRVFISDPLQEVCQPLVKTPAGYMLWSKIGELVWPYTCATYPPGDGKPVYLNGANTFTRSVAANQMPGDVLICFSKEIVSGISAKLKSPPC